MNICVSANQNIDHRASQPPRVQTPFRIIDNLNGRGTGGGGRGLAVVSPFVPTAPSRATLVNVGCRISGEPSRSPPMAKLSSNLGARPQLAVVPRRRWAIRQPSLPTIRGRNNSGNERLCYSARSSLRHATTGATAVMAQEQRAVVTPTRSLQQRLRDSANGVARAPAGRSWVGLSRAAAMIAHSVRPAASCASRSGRTVEGRRTSLWRPRSLVGDADAQHSVGERQETAYWWSLA